MPKGQIASHLRMAGSLDINNIANFLTRLKIKVGYIDEEDQTIGLSFYGEQGPWRLFIGLYQDNEIGRLILTVPFFGFVTERKRLECLEALLAANFRLAFGKFAFDLQDGEIRLEEVIPLANNTITFEQFRLVFAGILQTAATYMGLVSRVRYADCTAKQALEASRRDFREGPFCREEAIDRANDDMDACEDLPELSVEEVLEEVTRLLKETME